MVVPGDRYYMMLCPSANATCLMTITVILARKPLVTALAVSFDYWIVNGA